LSPAHGVTAVSSVSALRGQHGGRDGAKLREFAEVFMEVRVSKNKPSTRATYRYAIDGHIFPRYGGGYLRRTRFAPR
jgi:hypothetical protein